MLKDDLTLLKKKHFDVVMSACDVIESLDVIGDVTIRLPLTTFL